MKSKVERKISITMTRDNAEELLHVIDDIHENKVNFFTMLEMDDLFKLVITALREEDTMYKASKPAKKRK